MQDVIGLAGGTFCSSAGAFSVTGGAASTYAFANTVQISVRGKIKAVTTLSGQATPTTDYNTSAAFPALVGGASVANVPGHGCIVVWGMIADGTVKCVMGPHANLDMAGNFAVPSALQFPAIPEGLCPVAYQVLKAGATASATAIVFGTANWNAAGFTNVFQDVSVLPDRPQVS